jgi:mannose-6-phosphate isomerase-like protein (cupin superfamily)
MNVGELEKRLHQEGFTRTYTWRDNPNVFYPDHRHPAVTAHVILSGEMTVTSEGTTRVCRAGDRFDVPAEAVHSARMGPEGCTYLIGEK